MKPVDKMDINFVRLNTHFRELAAAAENQDFSEVNYRAALVRKFAEKVQMEAIRADLSRPYAEQIEYGQKDY